VPESEPRVRAVVAFAPGGSSRPVPGVLPLTLAFGWERVVPLLILTGDRDVPVQLDGVQEIFGRAPEPKRMFVLRRADHEHFADDVEGSHEALRAMTLPGEAAWMTAAMLPMSQLCPGEHGHVSARGLSLAHLDAVLRGNDAADRFLAAGAESALAARGVQAVQYQPHLTCADASRRPIAPSGHTGVPIHSRLGAGCGISEITETLTVAAKAYAGQLPCARAGLAGSVATPGGSAALCADRPGSWPVLAWGATR
jgi:hypothetical protein